MNFFDEELESNFRIKINQFLLIFSILYQNSITFSINDPLIFEHLDIKNTLMKLLLKHLLIILIKLFKNLMKLLLKVRKTLLKHLLKLLFNLIRFRYLKRVLIKYYILFSLKTISIIYIRLILNLFPIFRNLISNTNYRNKTILT